MLARYVLADLVRNVRRTLSTMVGVILGVGLFCGVLFFVDGLSASMTQRAVAPLPIDMQRIVTNGVGGALTLSQEFQPSGALAVGGEATVHLELANNGDVSANEVTVRSLPGEGLRFVVGTAAIDGVALPNADDNPFAHGPGRTGFNLGSIEPGDVRQLSYRVTAQAPAALDDATIATSYSSRERVSPTGANEPSTVSLDDLAGAVARIDGIAGARPLSLADLGSDTLSKQGSVASGPAKIFGFDAAYAAADDTIRIVDGAVSPDTATLSAEAAAALSVHVGDPVRAALPDGSSLDVTVGAIADLSEARSLFSSRRGGDLETFLYSANSIVVDPSVFDERVLPAYERAATERGGRLKNPPQREIDIALERDLLDADPASALVQTARIGGEVSAIAAHQDYLLDNISNTLSVAAADASVAKRLFVFLGLPGGLLAAMLAAYAGSVLAEAQRREHATLRIRGASRRHLLRMLMMRTALLTAAGALVGLILGYVAAAAVLGQDSLSRASAASLTRSAFVGSLGGFAATGAALYLTGRRSIDREISEDRAQLILRAPLWRRGGLDIIGAAVIAVGTVVAISANAFDGAAGSVYFGRAVELNLALLVLPVAVWITGSLLAARILGAVLARSQPVSSSDVGQPLPSLYRFSIGRRPWAIGNGIVVVSLIVALATSLVAFTASYDAAKADDARYANGSDIRITPGPTARRSYGSGDAGLFETDGVATVTPVIYGINNVILRSARTSDPANLVAIDPAGYAAVAPVSDAQFPAGIGAATLALVESDPTAVLLSVDMAGFLKASVGDPLDVLLARGTEDQVEVRLHIAGVFDRLPGFPDGADAAMSIGAHSTAVPSKAPDFFLAATSGTGDAALSRAVASLSAGPVAADSVALDTRKTTLARDQSSLAALNIGGLVDLDATFALAMAVVTVAIFVFGLLLTRRREYVTLRAQGLDARTIRLLIGAEAATVAVVGAVVGLVVGSAMGFYFVRVLRPLFVLDPSYSLPAGAAATPVLLVLGATVLSSVLASRMVDRLDPTELLRDE